MKPPVPLVLVLLAEPVAAQTDAAAVRPQQGPIQVIVRGRSRGPNADDMPLSRTVVDPELVARPGGLAPTEALATVPGVLVENRENQAQDVRIDVRGFGTRAAFGMRGVRVVLDGVPVTVPDGQTALDSLALSDLGRIEVVRGPGSVLYGGTPGGAILLFTEEAPESPEAGLSVLTGAYGTLELRSHAAGKIGPAEGSHLGYRLSTTAFTTDGYRDHARAIREALHLRLAWVPSWRTRIRLVADVSHAPLLEDPGGLTASELGASPRRAAPGSLESDTREQVRQLRSGVVLHSRLSEYELLDAAVYVSSRRFEGSRPLRIIRLDRLHPGASLQLTTSRTLFALPSTFAAGLNLDRQQDARRTLSNDGGRPEQPVLLDQRERVHSLGASAYEALSPLPPLTLLAGLRYEEQRYRLADELMADGNQSGDLTFSSLSALAGWALRAVPGVWFANLARSHENPTLAELTNRPDDRSGLNGLDPVRVASYEVGLRSEPFPGLRPELSLFRIGLRGELVPYEDESQRVYYRNAGRSHRQGLEATLGIQHRELLVRSTYTYIDARFDLYQRDGVSLAGYRVPGLPPHRWANTIRYGQGPGPIVGTDLVWYDAVFVNDSNDERSPGRLTTSLLAGYCFLSGAWEVTLEGRLQNLLGYRQPDSLRVNASGERYYEPAAGFSAFAGIEVVHRSRDAS